MKETCLVLGGAGFIGANLVEELLNLGYNVKIFEQPNFSKKNIEEFINQLEIIEGDFSNRSDIKGAMIGVDYIYHLISTTLPSSSLENNVYDIESNVVPTLQMLQISKEMKIKKVIFVSSGGTIYGIPTKLPIPENHPSNPITSYGIVKRTIENYFNLYQKLWGLNFCIFRLSNPYGEKQNPKGIQGIIPVLLHKAINQEEIQIWGDGEVIRDYIYIKDAIKIMSKAIRQETPEMIYNLGSGIGTSINNLLNIIKLQTTYNINVNYMESRNFDVPTNILDISLLKERFLVDNLVSLKDGIGKLHEYMLQENKSRE